MSGWPFIGDQSKGSTSSTSNVGIVIHDKQNVNGICSNGRWKTRIDSTKTNVKGKEKATYAMGNENERIQPLRDRNIGIVIRNEWDHDIIHVGNGKENSRVSFIFLLVVLKNIRSQIANCGASLNYTFVFFESN
ncbi:uncharacterized protein LOC131333133 isoform X2 [Rhododendron vialii]|uniref:uncharacterized protein LOC131333133 isoform X2 n=1 Tax=Rhododendron vialii TaxID=182163 RepID=UPI00265EE9D6|nr:uncharacterized protein LOC131333133 isoform X2 [Rhododendron vialii]